MSKLYFSPGSHINEAAKKLIAVAQTGVSAEGEFNGVTLVAGRNSTVETIVARYHEGLEAQSKAYRASPAGIAAEAAAVARKIAIQAEADALMAALPSLDMTDDVAVLEWLDRFQDPSDYIGIKADKAAVIRAFTDAGYVANANTGDDFREEDRDNHARYLVGQALSCLQSVGAIHQVFGTFHARWKARFLAPPITPPPLSIEQNPISPEQTNQSGKGE